MSKALRLCMLMLIKARRARSREGTAAQRRRSLEDSAFPGRAREREKAPQHIEKSRSAADAELGDAFKTMTGRALRELMQIVDRALD